VSNNWRLLRGRTETLAQRLDVAGSGERVEAESEEFEGLFQSQELGDGLRGLWSQAMSEWNRGHATLDQPSAASDVTAGAQEHDGRVALQKVSQAGPPERADAGVGLEDRERTSGLPATDPNDLVTLNQCAALVNRTKRCVENYKKNKDFPRPEVLGGGGKPHEYRYSEMRVWLQHKFGRKLPTEFPGKPTGKEPD
jgi:hypothetical protein